ncbi:MAG: hypothetical protein A3C30_03725 [Candidatus Levybacteria bacterium RIFCSPHIGHO2_02_FULL_40_18]|nr:MAG: hypothetical protein A3C30_03725 [Candidatus Levybacteria bacterium RIFCSPHIGHO2_02_FULL_40_18]OGH31351.1 MAG: hypothetical protein A3E43_03195 [Candidatus Levybacteria bacterium RIFCSPHIGHO2_12_FULL_40_31]OGH49041.1 MAG: hypothetical protein A3I54_00505 [Candidatus Levybacteria bacterium RIFCSPLOWO2_02_FULL_41_11]OGH54294.1 MAG: hypothetical protein A3G15_01030 [Candidatus Levybacteria bacterium RIFCSPLOWO2_12_FULL_40_10]
MNAIGAILYIAVVASVMFYGTKISGPVDSIIGPIAAISLFTLSAAVMAYVFGYEPFQLYFDGKKKQALDLALKTIAAFAIITAIILVLLFSGAVR